MPAGARGAGCLLFVWLVGWTVVSVIFAGAIGYALVQQARAATFPTADGHITHSGVQTGANSDGEASYRLTIVYEYEVDGRRYTGTRYCFAEMGTNTNAWHKIAAELPVGTDVRVSYDPDNPAESLL